jgi:SAM-dependent methyltransferase
MIRAREFWTDPIDYDTARERVLWGPSDETLFFEAMGDRHLDLITAGLPMGDLPRVLEIGTGVGRMASRFERRFPDHELTTVDISATMLDHAIHRTGIRSCALLYNGRDLPLVAGSIDLAYSFIVVQHMTRPDAFALLADVRRVLVPGGLLRFNVPDLAHPLMGRDFVGFQKRLLAPETDDYCHIEYYVGEELAVWARLLGFEEVGRARCDPQEGWADNPSRAGCHLMITWRKPADAEERA